MNQAIENVTHIQLKLCRRLAKAQDIGLTQKEAFELVSEELARQSNVHVSWAWVRSFFKNTPKEAAKAGYTKVLAMQHYVEN